MNTVGKHYDNESCLLALGAKCLRFADRPCVRELYPKLQWLQKQTCRHEGTKVAKHARQVRTACGYFDLTNAVFGDEIPVFQYL